MKLCSLASGSKGNALAVWTDSRGLLIDCGLSYRQLRRRMAMRDLDPANFGTVLISHSHGDHWRGLPHMAEHLLGLPIYASRPTLAKMQMGRQRLGSGPQVAIGPGGFDTFELSGIGVTVLPVVHNDEGSCTFVLEELETGKRLALVYETGRIPAALAEAARTADALCIESNYDPQMLANNPKLPVEIMERIAATHLSNQQAAAFLETVTPKTQLVLLLHLSQHNNTPELALASATAALVKAGGASRLVVACQDEPTEVIEI